MDMTLTEGMKTMETLQKGDSIMVNLDPKKSAQPCGCDEGANYRCEWHRKHPFDAFPIDVVYPEKQSKEIFPISAAERKEYPIFTGFMMYFPDAIAAVAHVSYIGNQQHNPGQPLHWARGKSMDQMDTAMRHSMDHGIGNTKDTDGTYHLAKAIWRQCAELQLLIEKEKSR
jgi:hypothetical protein